jgi:predicted HAD superfamily Cof-like phosphohydrolase
MSIQEMVTEFQTACGQPVGDPLMKQIQTYGVAATRRIYTDEERDARYELHELRNDLIDEEYFEFTDAPSPVDRLGEAADLVYVIFGWAVTYGFDLEEALRRKHAANMSKLVDGKPVLREDGKVLKGPNFKPADLSDLVAL